MIETTPEPVDPPPVELALKGRLVDASGAAAPFVPVRLGLQGGPVVATDEAGSFVFPDLPAGQHTVYAHDEFDDSVGFATIAASAEDDVTTVALQPCTELLAGGESTPNEVINLCFGANAIDLPPFEPAVTLAALELSGGEGYTNRANTGADGAGGDIRGLYFGFHDGLALGGVREFAVADHRLVGAEPNPEPLTPVFGIFLQDRHGRQSYVVRDGSFRIEITEGREATRGYVLTASNLVLDYGTSYEEFDAAYTLTVPSVRLEGTLDVELPPLAPEGDITAELMNPFVFGDLLPPSGLVSLGTVSTKQLLSIELDPTQLAFPGTVEIELPLGDEPSPDAGGSTILLDDGGSWSFQLVSYTVTTEMTALPACGEQLTLTLENLVFRYVGWDYDENSDEVRSFGEQSMTLERLDVDTTLGDGSNPGC